MGGGKDKQSAMELKKKQKTVTPVWRPVCTQAVSDEGWLVIFMYNHNLLAGLIDLKS